MNTIGILSILEGESYKTVKRLWKLFETKYNSTGVQTFAHPNITFQGGKIDNLKELKKDFEILIKKIKPFEIEINGLGHFNKKVIYLKVKKTKELININKLINQFLRSYSSELFEYYVPKNWIPHITLAMDDLTEKNFKKAWFELKKQKWNFKQQIHNICIVKWYPNKIRIIKKYYL